MLYLNSLTTETKLGNTNYKLHPIAIMNFKILAIQPLKDCDSKYSKVLTPGQIYHLYNNYTVTEEIVTCKEDKIPKGLYNTPNNLIVNISAVVGKNGSGKSTLVELLYAVIYIASWKLDLLPELDKASVTRIKRSKLQARIFFQKDADYYRLSVINTDVTLELQKNQLSGFNPLPLQNDSVKKLFYTIASSYSLYSLNSQDTRWLDEIFKKNDGYQLPVVINPFRDEGIIDINNEESLMTSRIVTNLLALRKDGKTITKDLAPGRTASQLKFILHRNKVRFTEKEKNLKRIIYSNKEFIIAIIQEIFGEGKKAPNETSHMIDTAKLYLCRKLFYITQRYRPYQGQNFQFIVTDTKSDNKSDSRKTSQAAEFDEKKLRELLKKMKKYPSHITLKFEQAVNFLYNFSFYQEYIGYFVDIDTLAKKLAVLARRSKKRLIEVIPPSIFKVDILFTNKSRLAKLSSGEKQKIYGAASWMYHLVNLNSVREEDKVRYHKYDCVNLIFDEIELYYHPEMQRRFVSDFLDSLSHIRFENPIGINCIFVTHSPFILSDIPNQNILFLRDDGKPDELVKDFRTFAANIHEILQHHFFLKDGTIGEFAQTKIESLIKYLKSKKSNDKEWNETTASQFILMISEPLIRQSLKNLFDSKFPPDEMELEAQREFLRLKIEELKNRRK